MKKQNKKIKKSMPFRITGLGAGILITVFCMSIPVLIAAEEMTKIEETETGFYKDAFDQNVYSEGINQLDFSRWGRRISGKKVPSANVNVFDEVPDSGFFVNRHARKRLSIAELEKGYHVNEGPDASKSLTVLAVEQNGLHYGFFVEDAKKDRYILRFDLNGNMELNTGAEVAASRFYYAIGYNVPQYTVFYFKADQLEVGADAVTMDNTGFLKKLTSETLDQYLSSMPQMPDGSFRASAQKLPPGEEAGGFRFDSRKKSDPQDKVNHRDRRDVRALQVFAAWLNDYELNESSSLDMRVTENGQVLLKHYLTDFSSSFGASLDGAKPPIYGHEYLVDVGEAFKAFLSLGFWEKPWQKKWREAGEKPHPSPAVGYFSSKDFDPGKYKTQLPYEAFRMVTRADGFWASKIIAAFTDADILAMVKSGDYTAPSDADYIAKTIGERRNLIAKYWFARSAPLDDFELSGGMLSFKDLAVEHGLEKAAGTSYSVEVIVDGKEKKEIAKFQTQEAKVAVDPSWFKDSGNIEAFIRVLRPSFSKESPWVQVTISRDAIQGIRHED